MGQFCLLADMTPVKKMVVNVAFVPYILMQFGFVHLLNRWSVSSYLVVQSVVSVRSSVCSHSSF